MAFIVGPMPRMDATLQCMNQVNIQSIFQLSSPLSFSLTCWDLTAQLHCYSYILQMVAKLPEFNVYLQKSALFLCTFSILISNSKYPSLTENINEFQFFSEMNFLISETYLLVYFMPFFYSVRMSYYFEGDATLLILVVYYS